MSPMLLTAMDFSKVDTATLGAILAVFGVFIVIAIILGIIVYIFTAFALMKIAQKERLENAWWAWIPILNYFLIAKIAKLEWWYALIALLSILIPYAGSLIMVGVLTYMWYKLAEARRKPGWWGIVYVWVPFGNLVILYLLAWGKE